jgi:hypothetical protein
MTEVELAAVRTRHADSTPGEWVVEDVDISGHWWRRVPFYVVQRQDPDASWRCIVQVDRDDYSPDPTDAEAAATPDWRDADLESEPARNLRFIAAAHQDIPALLAHIANLEEDVAQLKAKRKGKVG